MRTIFCDKPVVNPRFNGRDRAGRRRPRPLRSARSGVSVSTIGELLAAGRRQLLASPLSPNPREAALLLGHLLGRSEAQLLAHDEDRVAEDQVAAFHELLARRAGGEPVAYLVGEREFYGRPFRVDRRVLIPRPETEHLIEAALALPLPARPRVLDLGTGSGCLAVTFALERPLARVVATDLSLDALGVARTNVLRLDAAPRVTLIAADLAGALDLARFDLVLSNPPYLEPEELAAISIEVAEHEPHRALVAPAGARSIFARLLDAGARLARGGHLLFEIGYGQWPAIERELATRPFTCVEVRSDLAGIARVVVLRRR